VLTVALNDCTGAL